MDFDEHELKSESVEESEKVLLQNNTKSGDSLQSTLWINPNERDLEDLKK